MGQKLNQRLSLLRLWRNARPMLYGYEIRNHQRCGPRKPPYALHQHLLCLLLSIRWLARRSRFAECTHPLARPSTQSKVSRNAFERVERFRRSRNTGSPAPLRGRKSQPSDLLSGLKAGVYRLSPRDTHAPDLSDRWLPNHDDSILLAISSDSLASSCLPRTFRHPLLFIQAVQ